MNGVNAEVKNAGLGFASKAGPREHTGTDIAVLLDNANIATLG